jgi:hypothetical protein
MDLSKNNDHSNDHVENFQETKMNIYPNLERNFYFYYVTVTLTRVFRQIAAPSTSRARLIRAVWCSHMPHVTNYAGYKNPASTHLFSKFYHRLASSKQNRGSVTCQ